jgi:hypothetical protein
MDLNQLSDEDLLAIANGQMPASQTPEVDMAALEGLSDADLLAMAEGRAAPPSYTPDKLDLLAQPVAAAEMLGTMATTPLAGLVAYPYGAYKTATEGPQAGEQAYQEMRQQLTYEPKTDLGQAMAQGFGYLMEPVAETAKEYIKEPLTEFGTEKGGETAGFLAGNAPMLVLDLLGTKATYSLARGSLSKPIRLLEDDGTPTTALDTMLAKKGLVYDNLTPEAKSVIPKQIDNNMITQAAKRQMQNEALKEQVESGGATGGTAKYEMRGGKLKTDPEGKAAVGQDWTEGTVASVKDANVPTQKRMLEMVRMHRAIKDKPELGIDQRPLNIVGDEITKRYKVLQNRMELDGGKLDKIVEGNEGAKAFNPSGLDIMGILENKLDLRPKQIKNEYGVLVDKLDSKGRPVMDWESSIIAENPAAKNAIIRALRLSYGKGSAPTVREAHILKRQLDELVDYSKTADGLKGKAESAIKEFRRNINDALDQQVKGYGEVNARFTKTFDVRDRLQRSVGTRDITRPEDMGSAARTLLSNNVKQPDLMRALNDLDAWSAELGGKNVTNIAKLTNLAVEMDQRIFPVAKTSFGGETAAAGRLANRDLMGALYEGADAVYKRATGVTPNKQYSTMIELLQKGINQGHAAKGDIVRPTTDIVPTKPAGKPARKEPTIGELPELPPPDDFKL